MGREAESIQEDILPFALSVCVSSRLTSIPCSRERARFSVSPGVCQGVQPRGVGVLPPENPAGHPGEPPSVELQPRAHQRLQVRWASQPGDANPLTALRKDIAEMLYCLRFNSNREVTSLNNVIMRNKSIDNDGSPSWRSLDGR